MLCRVVSLLRDIQASAVGTDTSVAVLLRQCLVLSSRLQHQPLREWANLELNGYPPDAELPPYRPKFATEVIGDFSGPMMSSMRAPLAPASIPRPLAHLRERLFTAELREGVAAMEALLAGDDPSLSIPWPQDAVVAMQDSFIEFMSLMRARQVIPVPLVAAMLSGIRDRVVQFALDIETENPAAGEAAPGEPPISEQRVTQIFNQHFYGDHAAVATAGRDVLQQVTGPIDLAGLETVLRRLGISDEDCDALISAVQDDERLEGATPGPHARAWLERLQSGSIQLGSGVAIGTATTMLGRLLGVA